jgi:hypothetical protein
MDVANVMAYYEMSTITAVKSFTVQAPDHLVLSTQFALDPWGHKTKLSHPIETYSLLSMVYSL